LDFDGGGKREKVFTLDKVCDDLWALSCNPFAPVFATVLQSLSASLLHPELYETNLDLFPYAVQPKVCA